jgi:hypothetical protein
MRVGRTTNEDVQRLPGMVQQFSRRTVRDGGRTITWLLFRKENRHV